MALANTGHWQRIMLLNLLLSLLWLLNFDLEL